MTDDDYEPASTTDEELIEAIEQLYEAGKIDDGDGGVHHSTVAAHLDVSVSTAKRRCDNLSNTNKIRQVLGINPETTRKRYSYEPID